MAEGYAGTLEAVDALNNFWGWTAVAREIVRDDQWQRFKEVYVDDALGIGIKEWFERENHHAQAQMIERMLEAARKKYWDADAGTVKELARRYRALQQRFGVASDNRRFEAFLNETVPPREAGPGLALPVAPLAPKADRPQQIASPADSAAQSQRISGVRMEPVPSALPPRAPMADILVAAFLALLVCVGATDQWRRQRTRAVPRPRAGTRVLFAPRPSLPVAAVPQPGNA